MIAEDRAAGKERPLRAGIHREINVSPLTHGEWFDIGKGSIWLFEIDAPTASGIDVHFTDVYLPEGAKIYVYSPSAPEKYRGPYRGGPELWVGPISGDKIIIEVAIPVPYDHSKPPFKIEGVGHLYRPSKQKSTLENIAPLAATCHNDATCYPDWAIEGDAVGRIYYRKGSLPYLCTGTIINDLSGDHTPYFLTANHCIPDDFSSISLFQVYWFYETNGCLGTAPDMFSLPYSEDAIYLAGKTKDEFSDFTLLELLGKVPLTLSWAEWTTKEPSVGDSAIGIHHPSDIDDYRRISFGNKITTHGCIFII
ncbi:MAG: hypothetical protein FJ241_12845 [Nitrospira sp.]|nr:hypothetical protein [Nitrospira sp.]